MIANYIFNGHLPNRQKNYSICGNVIANALREYY